MDDPLFDPWGEEPESPPAPGAAPRTLKWRSAAPAGTRATPSRPAPARRSDGPARRARLAGTRGFLRSMAAPRLDAIALRVQIARHEAKVEDDLDGAQPALRLHLRPWRGPFTRDPGVGWETFELSLEEGPEDRVVAGRWTEATQDAPEDLESVPATKLSAAWVEAHALAFVAAVLKRV